MRWLNRLLEKGCIRCGGVRMEPVDLSALVESTTFTGTLRRCSACGQVFADCLTVGEDRKLLPLAAFFDTLSRCQRDHPASLTQLGASHSVCACLIPRSEPPRTSEYEIIVGRHFQSDAGVDLIFDLAYYCLCVQNTVLARRVCPFLSLGIDGWSDDPRPITEIPQVVAFYQALHSKASPLPLWLTKRYLPIYLASVAAGTPDSDVEEWYKHMPHDACRPKSMRDKSADPVLHARIAAHGVVGGAAVLRTCLKDQQLVDRILMQTPLYKAIKTFNTAVDAEAVE